MSREDRKLRKHFEERARRETRKANKHISAQRAGETRPPRERLDLRWVEDEDAEPSAPQARLRRKEHEADHGVLLEAVAVEAGAGFCDVLSAGQRIRCRSLGDAAIGDRVLFSQDRRRIVEVLPRRTVLSRPDPQNPRRERVIAANIDVVVNVVSLKSPPLHPGLIDRYLIAIARSGADALVCVNKIDLLEQTGDLEPLAPYRDLGIPVICCSAATGQGMGELASALAGRMCVFAGHSGVGKSSLLNALDPEAGAAIGSVSESTEKGRHTTTSSNMYHLAGGAIVIDTPGVREFGLWSVTRDDVRRYYVEFGAWECAFSDCSHTHEPDCGVRDAVAAGQIARARYDGYLRILASL